MQPATLYATPLITIFAAGISPVSFGVARAAIDAFVQLAEAKTPMGSAVKLRDKPTVQADVRRAEALLGSARPFYLNRWNGCGTRLPPVKCRACASAPSSLLLPLMPPLRRRRQSIFGTMRPAVWRYLKTIRWSAAFAMCTQRQEYCRRLRIGRAREMLELTGRTIGQLAWGVGYQYEGSFRKVFQKVIGPKPGDYRKRFGVSQSTAFPGRERRT
jgi:AraC-like DNA-binding protein